MAQNHNRSTSDASSAASSTANSAQFLLSQILSSTKGELVSPRENSRIETLCTGVSTDTRTLQNGALFIALKGENFDGHKYLTQAAEAGAIVAIVEKDSLAEIENAPQSLALITVESTLEALGDLAAFHRRRFDIPVVAITGSYGKTTTRAMTSAALSAKFKVLTSQGNFNNEIGVPQTLLQLDASHQAVVIEMGMRGLGQIEYLSEIASPTIGVITNIGPQHIELLGSIQNIAQAKSEVLRFLPEHGAAILSGDDEYLDFFTDQVKARVVTFGLNPSCEFHVGPITTDENGNVAFTIQNSELKTETIKLPMPGEHNAVNAAAALAVAGVLGVPLEDAARALEKVEVPGARMRVVKNEKRGLTIIDDCYNAGPNSMRAALQTLRDFPINAEKPGRRVAILGAMKELGNHSEAEHRGIGALAAHCAELVIGVGEDTRPLLEEAQAVGAIPFQTQWCEDAERAATGVLDWLREGDLILVKGSRSVGLELVVNALADNE